MNKLLFLDFDGVLHPNFCHESAYFSRANCLLNALGDNVNGLKIVISSSWRFHHQFDDLLNLLPHDLGLLIIGATPEVGPGRHQRYREIQAYLSMFRGRTDWRALDDDATGFPVGCEELIWCNGKIGIDAVSASSIGHWLQHTE